MAILCQEGVTFARMRMMGFCCWIAAFIASLNVICLGLAPRDIVLITNKNSPESGRLAALYGQLRSIPPDQLISLDLPSAEEMSFDDYERKMVPPVRDFLRAHHMDRSTTCLCTFYGVPFRIRARISEPGDEKELTSLHEKLDDVVKRSTPITEGAEALAKSLSPDFEKVYVPKSVSDLDGMMQRANHAMQVAGAAADALGDEDAKRKMLAQLANLYTQLGGLGELYSRFGPGQLADSRTTADQRRKWVELRQQLQSARQQISDLEDKRFDAPSRQQTRDLTEHFFGLLNLGHLIEVQIDYLTPGVTNAATDNELSLVMWQMYPRSGMQINTLNYKSTARFASAAVMVSRLDGPDEATVASMIKTSAEVEKTGLTGCVALNSYGFPKASTPGQPSAYLQFDQKIRNLGTFIKFHTHLELREQYDRLFRNREVQSVALYCGWYSLRHYSPGMVFAPGAVGFHVASLEMVGLHGSGETGWVHGLINDGVVGTVGPVAEPYLLSFPPPDEFYPLLLTGRLTLAETYWKTEKMASWMQCLVGDPLYTPFKAKPATNVEDLPEELRTAVSNP